MTDGAPPRQSRRAAYWLLGVVLVLVLVVLAQTATGHSVLRRTGVLLKPERYSELVFTPGKTIPLEVPRGPAKMPVPFSVHNVEGGLTEYAWKVVARPVGQSPTILAQGDMSVSDGRTGFRSPHVTVPCHVPRVRLEVSVDRPNLSIGRWIKCVPGGSGG